jgi:hypothetical protein
MLSRASLPEMRAWDLGRPQARYRGEVGWFVANKRALTGYRLSPGSFSSSHSHPHPKIAICSRGNHYPRRIVLSRIGLSDIRPILDTRVLRVMGPRSRQAYDTVQYCLISLSAN